MESYKERYLKETQELEHRIARLSLLIHRYEFGLLDFELNCPIDLLKGQLEVMLKYADILDRRYKYEFPTETASSETETASSETETAASPFPFVCVGDTSITTRLAERLTDAERKIEKLLTIVAILGQSYRNAAINVEETLKL